CHLLVDVSDSMRYRSEAVPLTKLEYAVALAAALGYLITRQQDAVGLMTFGESVLSQLQPSSRSAHLGQLCRQLDETDPGRIFSFMEAGDEELEADGTIERSLVEASQRMRRRGLVIVL